MRLVVEPFIYHRGQTGHCLRVYTDWIGDAPGIILAESCGWCLDTTSGLTRSVGLAEGAEAAEDFERQVEVDISLKADVLDRLAWRREQFIRAAALHTETAGRGMPRSLYPAMCSPVLTETPHGFAVAEQLERDNLAALDRQGWRQ